ncbi:MAG: enoyl-CoA hydratase-related protein [Georgfuchsia sp.]
MSNEDILLYEKKGHIVIITINRPERMNTFTPELYDRFNEAWIRYRDDNDARVAIVTAAGDRAFSTGMDLKDQAERVAKDPSFDIVKLKPGVVDGSEGTPRGNKVYKPVIAAVNGIATAGGFQLLMQCDIRIAVEGAKIGISEAKVGRGSPWAVPLLFQMPTPIAAEILLTASLMPAKRLYDVGWINQVVPADQLMSAAMKMAELIQDNAPLSLMAAKMMLNKIPDELLKEGLEMAKKIYEPVYASEDAQEGPRSFAEKRKPVWKGK